jgi:nitrogen fixation/metabolism regulation signal transduction histidine kinase
MGRTFNPHSPDEAAILSALATNGTGIPPEYRDRLFQPFFTTKPTGEGTGLGLSISYDIVTQQNARFFPPHARLRIENRQGCGRARP